MVGWLIELVVDLNGPDDLFDRSDPDRPTRRSRRTGRRLAALAAGRPVVLRVAARSADRPGTRWRRAALRLTSGRAHVAYRFHGAPDTELTARSAEPLYCRRPGRLRRRAVLAYRTADGIIELGVAPADLPLVARVLRLPPYRC
jgi:hypothetical protein